MAWKETAPSKSEAEVAPTAEIPAVEKLLKVTVDGRGWNIFKLINFTMEVYSESKFSKGTFVVNEYSCQPFGVLHGGTTAYVAEGIASMMSSYAADFNRIAGVELNCNSLRPAGLGSTIFWSSKPFLLGKKVHVWEIRFEAEKPKPAGSDSKTPEMFLVAVSRVTIMIIPQDEFSPKKEQGSAKFVGMTFTEL